MENTTPQTTGTGISAAQTVQQITFSRIHVSAIRLGLKARQVGMFITSPAKGGSTKNLLSLLTNITGISYVSGKRGIEEAIRHCTALLEASEPVTCD
jgi:hypothetical protein